LRARVWHPHTRIDIRLLGPCFKTGRSRPLRQHPRRGAVLGPGGPHGAAGYNTPRGELRSRGIYPAARTDAGLRAAECPRASPGGPAAPKSGRERFPFNNFTCCLTLFPKCFSSFDHSTCALSVSGRYLALDGIYHPFRAAFPNNSTRRRSPTWAEARGRGRDSHPLGRPVPGDLCRRPTQGILCRLQLGPGGPDFKSELLPLHSPLLRQSLLVSFPPLIDMLKFSGYPYLIRGQPGGFPSRRPRGPLSEERLRSGTAGPATGFGARRRRGPRPSRARVASMTLGQVCPPGCRGAQCAFKDSMIHGILQFTLLIAFRCVLHRYQSQEIRC
jgi:hypothetical protein